uniref:Uncharacterized protein n=1 Tax=Cacopsylla melanoneura TaxID=428564 RepID=A0A8D9FAW9_9HEMI
MHVRAAGPKRRRGATGTEIIHRSRRARGTSRTEIPISLRGHKWGSSGWEITAWREIITSSRTEIITSWWEIVTEIRLVKVTTRSPPWWTATARGEPMLKGKTFVILNIVLLVAIVG